MHNELNIIKIALLILFFNELYPVPIKEKYISNRQQYCPKDKIQCIDHNNNNQVLLLSNKKIKKLIKKDSKWEISKIANLYRDLIYIFHDSNDIFYVITNDWEKKESFDANLYQNYKTNINYFNRVYRSLDLGLTWELASIIPSDASGYTTTKNGYIFITNIIDSENGYGVFRSEDQGSTWKRRNLGLPPYPQIDYIYTDFADNIYAYTKNNIYISKNYGEEWSLLSSIFPENKNNKNYRRIVHNSNTDMLVSLENDTIFYFSYDMGINWTKVLNLSNTFLKNSLIQKFHIDNDNNIIICTDKYGIHSIQVHTSPISFTRLGNYENLLLWFILINHNNEFFIGTEVHGLIIINLGQ